MAVQKEWLKFFREQYPLGSRIKLREMETPQEGLGRGSMGTLKKIDDNAQFHIELHYICTTNDNFTKYEAIYLLFYDDWAIHICHRLWKPITIHATHRSG